MKKPPAWTDPYKGLLRGEYYYDSKPGEVVKRPFYE